MNPRLAEVPPSVIRSINARKRPGDINLGLGEPTLPPDLAPFEAALEWTRLNGSPYSPNAGFPDLREGVAAYLDALRWAAGPITAANVCITVGSEEALYLAIKTVIDPAVDEVLIVEPCYLAYPKICLLEGIRHRLVPLDPADEFRPRASTILDALRPETRLVIINTPGNPTGRVWPEAECEELARGLERAGRPVHVLADEVYRELYYGESPPPAIATHHPHTLVAGSLSKSNALTGLRVGWLAGDSEIVGGAIKVHQFVNTAVSTFAQRVAAEIFATPERLGDHRPAYHALREGLLAAAHGAGLHLIPPEGAFYALLRLPASLAGNSLAAAERIHEETRVITIPGAAFGDSGEGWLRISWVAEEAVLREGVDRLADWLTRNG